MATTKSGPVSLTIRTYGVGFGDCFLLTFAYAGGKDRHVLVDFGTVSQQAGVPANHMLAIANDIAKVSGGKLTAVIATHRHKDHISGFTPGKNGKKREGDVIRSLNPDLVVQPWTEQPDLAQDATKLLLKQQVGGGPVAHVATLGLMQGFSANMLSELPALARDAQKGVIDHLSFVGQDNVKDVEAVKNLIAMGKASKAVYLSEGKSSGLEALLPGVKVHVLGPPTIAQAQAIKHEAPKEPGDYWKLQAAATRFAGTKRATGGRLFPKAKHFAGPRLPQSSRWFVGHARRQRAEQLVGMLTILDAALNNTSLILLFEIGSSRFLFPGDAQIENWNWALGKAEYKTLLKSVNLYKVGHHGSRNATPPELWKLFANRSPNAKNAGRLTTLLSTKADVYGKAANAAEVPRVPLLHALQKETNLHESDALSSKQLCDTLTVALD